MLDGAASCPEGPLSPLQGHGAWISDAAITRIGSHVVTVSGDSTGILWNATTGAAQSAVGSSQPSLLVTAL